MVVDNVKVFVPGRRRSILVREYAMLADGSHRYTPPQLRTLEWPDVELLIADGFFYAHLIDRDGRRWSPPILNTAFSDGQVCVGLAFTHVRAGTLSTVDAYFGTNSSAIVSVNNSQGCWNQHDYVGMKDAWVRWRAGDAAGAFYREVPLLNLRSSLRALIR